jgi:hypothetical protein
VVGGDGVDRGKAGREGPELARVLALRTPRVDAPQSPPVIQMPLGTRLVTSARRFTISSSVFTSMSRTWKYHSTAFSKCVCAS